MIRGALGSRFIMALLRRCSQKDYPAPQAAVVYGGGASHKAVLFILSI